MEKERSVKLLIISILFMLIAGLTVVFAALSTSLNINGTAYLDAAKWGIKFENLSSPTAWGTATTTGAAKIEETKSAEITGINVSLSTPGDLVRYSVNLVNEGTINAKIDNIEKTVLTEEQQRYLSFKVRDVDTLSEVKENDVLKAGETKQLIIDIMFIDDITKDDLPKQTSTISLSYKLNFVQINDLSIACTQFEKKNAYSIGDEISLCNSKTGKSEDFYVMRDNGDTVEAFAKYNVNTTSNLQEKSATIFKFANSDESNKKSDCTGMACYYGYWTDNTSDHNLLSKYGTSYPVYVFDSNSNLYSPLNNYETYLKSTLGKSSVTTKLITYEDLINLGCNSDDNTCASAPDWLFSSRYWTGSAYNNNRLWDITSLSSSSRKISYTYFNNPKVGLGLRPVITIKKSEL